MVSEPTIRNWVTVLNNIYYSFEIVPWSKNVSRSLLKTPKIYLWDWSIISDVGVKIENFVACHLKKAVDFWNDVGLGKHGLYYLRDKDKREVDFLITKDNEPWIMIEVKNSNNNRLSQNLLYFKEQLNVPHVFQAVANADYINKDCFKLVQPMIVPLKTLLSQLI